MLGSYLCSVKFKGPFARSSDEACSWIAIVWRGSKQRQFSQGARTVIRPVRTRHSHHLAATIASVSQVTDQWRFAHSLVHAAGRLPPALRHRFVSEVGDLGRGGRAQSPKGTGAPQRRGNCFFNSGFLCAEQPNDDKFNGPGEVTPLLVGELVDADQATERNENQGKHDLKHLAHSSSDSW